MSRTDTEPEGEPLTERVDLGVAVTSERYRVDGIHLHAVTAGDEGDPVVVLLHGFPEFWYGWHRSIAPLVEAGYRVVVPDQRGYNRSDKPEDVDAYRTSRLAADVAGLIDSTAADTAHVVGHDWGGAVAWTVALRHPALVDTLAVCNLPHPEVFEDAFPGNPRQLLRSWYMFLAQVPTLPERLLCSERVTLLPGPHSADQGTFSETDLDRYRTAWERDGAATGMLNWYRALFRHPESLPRTQVAAPTLLVWGERDKYLLAELAEPSLAYCADGRLERLDATHWVQHERADEVNRLLVEHLDANGNG